MRWSLDGLNLMAIRGGSTIFEILATKDVFFKVYEEVLGLLDFLAFFRYHFDFGGSNAYNWLSNKETQPDPGTCFSNSKKQVVSKWAGLKNKHPFPMEKKHIHAIFFWEPLFVYFRSPRGPKKKNMNSEAQPPSAIAASITWPTSWPSQPSEGFLGGNPSEVFEGSMVF